MLKKPVLVGILIFAALIALIAFSTMNMAKARVEVCMDYKGRTSCRTAAGATKEFALRTAITNACAEITSGVTEVLGCEHTEPTATNWK
jgi:hypothetical protein